MPTRNKGVTETFSNKVKQVVMKIPKGTVMTYKEAARLAGNGMAFRAVATIMRKNYDPAIPCHRVIRSDGKVGEYNRGGPKEKLHILLQEGWNQQL